MPIWAIPAIVAFGLMVIVLLALQHSDRWRLMRALGKIMGATEKEPGFFGDHLTLEGRHDGKRYQVQYYVGAKHAPAHLSLNFLVRAPEEGIWKRADDVPAAYPKEAVAEIFALGADLEAGPNGVRATLTPAKLSDPALAVSAKALLPVLGRVTRTLPALERDIRGRARPVGLFVELVLLAAGNFALFRLIHGQTTDALKSALYACPVALALVLIRDWVYRKQAARLQKGSREGIRRALWGLYAITGLMGVYVVNEGFDRSASEEMTKQILEGRMERRWWREMPVVYLEPFQAGGYRVRLQVTRDELYRNVDNIRLWVRQGALGIPWVERYEIVP